MELDHVQEKKGCRIFLYQISTNFARSSTISTIVLKKNANGLYYIITPNFNMEKKNEKSWIPKLVNALKVVVLVQDGYISHNP